jgi:hypothetical protein
LRIKGGERKRKRDTGRRPPVRGGGRVGWGGDGVGRECGYVGMCVLCFVVVSTSRLNFLVLCPASDFHSSSYHRPTYQVEYPVPAAIVLIVSGGGVVGEYEVSECVLEPPCFSDVFEQGFYHFWVCKKDREGTWSSVYGVK